ncbi:hypothetical protein KJZ63_02045 [Patescibacteria group bacterium]|nr:hypothetical protein [Patescibacteria group bacterium]
MTNVAHQTSAGNNSPNINGDHNSVTIGIKTKVSNEVKTIQLIISTLTRLSKDQESSTSDKREIDPEKKIKFRFDKYADELINLYAELSIKYKAQYFVVMRDYQIPRTDVDVVCSFLRIKSAAALMRNQENPITALDDLCEYLESKFYSDDLQNFDYDSGAVRYYLYNQLVACNVFPNPTHE